jgi:hypothetical protein
LAGAGGAGIGAGAGDGAGGGTAFATGIGVGSSLTAGRGGLILNLIVLVGSSCAGTGAGVAEVLDFEDALSAFFPFPFVSCVGAAFVLGNTPEAVFIFQACWI